MEGVAEGYALSLGLACVSVHVTASVDGVKALSFPKPWRGCTVESFRDHIDEGCNGLAALTGPPSDVYVIDVDSKDGGLEAWDYMQSRFQPVPDDTPRAKTMNGGMHLYFSFSESVAAGLQRGNCRTRISYNGEQVSIDSRGEGGIILLPPTRADRAGGEGTSSGGSSAGGYEWIREIETGRGNLRALPPWLAEVLNADGGAPAKRARMDAFNPAPEPEECEVHDIDGQIVDRILACLALSGDTGSFLDRVKDSPDGPMYVFRVSGSRTCVQGNRHSGRNNFTVLLRGQSLLYCCSSSECAALTPKEIGTIPFGHSTWGGASARVDPFDKGVYSTLTMSFMERNMLESDLGGAQVFSRMYSRCGRIVYSETRVGFMVWDGKRYVPDPKGDRVRLVCAQQLSGAYRRFRHALEDMLADEQDTEAQKRIKDQIKAIPNWTKVNNIKNAMEFLKATMRREGFDASLGANPDVLNAANGAVDLRSGRLLRHSTSFVQETVVSTEYRGLDGPTPTIDAFFADIFNRDTEVVEYMRRLLGYSITGHTSQEILVIFWGSGANGKGLLASMLSRLLEGYYIAMQKACLVKADGQRSAPGGAASPHLAELRGRRVGLVDESARDERLDAATVKLCTGGGEVNARFLYGQNFTFTPTHQAFLLTNHRPEIDVDDQAILRRIVLVPFRNQYKTAESYDPGNPSHRLRDDSLKVRMVTPEVLSEFLTWLVRGSVEWYREGLGSTPELLKAAAAEYYSENDVLGGFVKDMCVAGEGKKVTTSAFKAAFEQATGVRMSSRDLCTGMRSRGFDKRPARIDGDLRQCFIGVDLQGACEGGEAGHAKA